VIKFLVWLLLLAVCWPLALLALVLWPVVWLLSLPFRLVGMAVAGVLELCARSSCCRGACSARGPAPSPSKESDMGFITALIIGGIVGWLASMVMKTTPRWA